MLAAPAASTQLDPPGALIGCHAAQHKDAGAYDAARAEKGEVPGAQHLAQAARVARALQVLGGAAH